MVGFEARCLIGDDLDEELQQDKELALDAAEAAHGQSLQEGGTNPQLLACLARRSGRYQVAAGLQCLLPQGRPAAHRKGGLFCGECAAPSCGGSNSIRSRSLCLWQVSGLSLFRFARGCGLENGGGGRSPIDAEKYASMLSSEGYDRKRG